MKCVLCDQNGRVNRSFKNHDRDRNDLKRPKGLPSLSLELLCLLVPVLRRSHSGERVI
jgi:hypothetical protein